LIRHLTPYPQKLRQETFLKGGILKGSTRQAAMFTGLPGEKDKPEFPGFPNFARYAKGGKHLKVAGP
jgi:hypothetical protein